MPLLARPQALYRHYRELARDSGDHGLMELSEWLELLNEVRNIAREFSPGPIT